jgi:DNA repair exonuclease SbcCD ATPase subunit
MNLKDLRYKIERLRGAKQETMRQISAMENQITEFEKSLIRHKKAREIVREVGLKTQQQLQFHIGNITTLALESIFNDPYKLTVEFIQRRNKTECDLFFERDGEKVNPLSASGGGAIDVASFALRIASWSMERPRTRNTIILDEPMRFLSVDLQEKASAMIKELSEKLGLQFIIVTHEEELASYADKEFRVTINKGVSNIKEM